MAAEHTYSIGVEEEYFVFNAHTRRAAARSDRRFIARATRLLGTHVVLEMLQSQIEVMTPPCATLRDFLNALGYG